MWLLSGCRFEIDNAAPVITQVGDTKQIVSGTGKLDPRHVFDRVGLFEEEWQCNEDEEFNYRLRKASGRIYFTPRIRSRYYSRSSLLSLWRQYFQYGYWKVRVLQKHPRQMLIRQFVPPAFVATLLGLIVPSLFSPYGRGLLALVVGAYFIANLTASIFVSARHGWRHLPLLPLVFAILHFSYGIGFLIGLVKFANRWGDRQGKVPFFESADV